jgi:hypothetical protein
MSTLPLILAIDEDPDALARITHELQRYARDYEVICGPSTEAAQAQLETLHENGEAVAIVLAARGSGALKGERLLERVHELHPHAKRALLIPWGGWADEETASAIRNAMAMGHIDYYALKPFSSPDEIFHRLISEFLQEWRRQNAPGRRELTVVANPLTPKGDALRTYLSRNGVPYAFHTPDSREGMEFLAACNPEGAAVPVVVLEDGTPLVDPQPEDVAQFGTRMRTQLDHTEFDVVIVGAGQAAVHLARYAANVTLVCRGSGPSAYMSQYLLDEIESRENIHIRTETQVLEAQGDGRLERVTLRGPEGDETLDASGLFILIGAEPRADWLPPEIERDERGFVVAGPTYETSVAGVFAIGDVRAGSVKRVASAVGEGSVVIQHVHRYLEAVEERAHVR